MTVIKKKVAKIIEEEIEVPIPEGHIVVCHGEGCEDFDAVPGDLVLMNDIPLKPFNEWDRLPTRWWWHKMTAPINCVGTTVLRPVPSEVLIPTK